MFSKNKKSTDPKASPAPSKPTVPSIFSTDLKITGDLLSDGEIQIDGTILGDIRSRVLLVGEKAQITGEIIADTVRVHGTVNGQIKAKTVNLAKNAHVVGDILHENLSIEKGAFLEGHITRMEDGVDLLRDPPASVSAQTTLRRATKDGSRPPVDGGHHASADERVNLVINKPPQGAQGQPHSQGVGSQSPSVQNPSVQGSGVASPAAALGKSATAASPGGQSPEVKKTVLR